MKKIKLIIAATLFALTATAQTPPFTSIDAAFAKVVMTTYDSQIFKETGLHANQYKLLPKKEVKEWLDKYSEENSYFSAYPSTRCQELYWASKPNYPDDECHVFFSANSPKVGNEEYKSIVFEVVYTRLKNSVLTNTWEFKYYQYGGYYVFNKKGLNGNLMVENVIKALMQTKKPASKIEYEPVDLNGNKYIFHFNFSNMSSIDSITFEKNELNKSNYHINFYGTYQNFQYGDNCLPSSSGTIKTTADVTTVEEGGKVVETQMRTSFKTTQLSEVKKPKEGFKNAEELTFAQLYKQPKQPKCESTPGVAFKYEAPQDRKAKFLECIYAVMADGKQLKDPEKLKEYLTPDGNTGYDKFIALFKALEDQGYGWRDFKEGGENQFKYEIFGRKLINKMYKEDKILIYFETSVKDVTYFRLDP